LRERGDDLPELANSILSRLAQAQGRPVPQLGPDALAALHAYPFPGNVRELENILERALALADGNVIEAADLRLPATGSPKPATTAPAPAATAGADPRTLDPRDTASSRLPEYMEQLERDAIQQALVENRYNKTRAAAALGITFRALRYKLKKLGID
jgi:two-component system response regulator PilR (NtrC family)